MAEILDIPAEEYRKRPGVNPSLLEIIAEKSERHLQATLAGLVRTETEAMRFGTLFHQRILEPDKMDYHVHPETFTDDEGKSQKWHWGKKPCKAWRAAHSDKPIISPDDVRYTEGMADSLRNYPEFMDLFRGGKSEMSLFATDSHGTKLKGRVDRLHMSGNYVLDLKKTVSCRPEDFGKQIVNMGYHRKAYAYLKLCSLCGLNKQVFILAAVEAAPPYVAQLYRLSASHLDVGRMEHEALLQRYRNAVGKQEFPAYGGGIQTIELPEWYEDQTEELV